MPTSGDDPCSAVSPCSTARGTTSCHSAPAPTRARRPATSMSTAFMREVLMSSVSPMAPSGIAL
jgi:hypothetical protein